MSICNRAIRLGGEGQAGGGNAQHQAETCHDTPADQNSHWLEGNEVGAVECKDSIFKDFGSTGTAGSNRAALIVALNLH